MALWRWSTWRLFSASFALGASAVDLVAAIGDRTAREQDLGGVMKRIVTGTLLAVLAAASLSVPSAQAQTAPSARPAVQATAPTVSDASAQQRRRTLRRIPIYRQDHWEPDVIPRYNPGPNAVRDCTATYVQEYRPSGTVITPRMNCFWRPG